VHGSSTENNNSYPEEVMSSRQTKMKRREMDMKHGEVCQRWAAERRAHSTR